MTLRDEILAGETPELEFKEARPKDALKYVKTAVAFANGRGGRLVFGVEDGTRHVIGVDPENVFREVDAIVDAIANASDPAISLTTKIANVENRPLIVAGEDVPGIRPPRVRCRAYRRTDKSVWYDQRECEGPIAEQIHDAYAFVCKNMRVGSELVGTRRRDVYELPVGSVREAICNAVFHRNYLEPSEVYVALYDDRLEITSPGGLVRDMTIEQAEHGYSKIRNDGLALALSYMKEVEGCGGGVARYFSDWTTAGLPRPKLEETPGFFKVVFVRKKRTKPNDTVNEPVNEPVKVALVQTIRNSPGIGRSELMRVTGKSRATVTRALTALVGLKIVEHRGSDKTGGYYLTSEKGVRHG